MSLPGPILGFRVDRQRADPTLLSTLYPRLGWLDSQARLRGELRRKLRMGRLHDDLPALARDVVRRELAALVAQVLATPLSEVAASGWRRSSRLHDAAMRTRVDLAATEVVVLGEHTITFTDLPCIDVRVDGVPGLRLDVAIVVELHLGAVVATVRGGRLVEVRGAASDVTVALGISGERICRRFARIDIDAIVRAAVPTGAGIPLVDLPASLPGSPVGPQFFATARSRHRLAPRVDQL